MYEYNVEDDDVIKKVILASLASFMESNIHVFKK